MLTPQGVAEKTRLTYEYMGHSLQLFRRTRENLRAAMPVLTQRGIKRIALFGIGEAAELAYLTLQANSVSSRSRSSRPSPPRSSSDSR